MQMTIADQKTYPKFARYVEHELKKIMNVPSIIVAMNTIGQINKARLALALTWGKGPAIKIVPGLGACGEFTPNVSSDEIRVQEQIVLDFENGKGIRTARGGRVYAVGVTLLHELVHWGDDQDGIDRPGEEGNEFERAVYGSVIPC